MSDLKNRFLALKASVPFEVVDVPGVGPITIRGMTAAGRDEWEQRIFHAQGKTLRNIRATMITLCAYDGDSPLFTAKDLDAIGELPASVVDSLYDVAARLSGMGQSAKEQAEGNSDSGR